MSVFCGIVRWDRAVVEEDLRSMAAVLGVHPGDEARTLTCHRLAFHQRTLWISPESKRERLPRREAEDGITLVADAWLYYRDDLVRRLGLDGPAGAWTDSALILRAYRRWGVRCVAYLEGPFAFILWDEREGHVFAARDAMGLRPLFYHWTPRALRVSSDLSALAASPAVSRGLNDRYFAQYLLDTPLPRDETSHTSINRLPPGCWMLATSKGVTVEQYWNPEDLPPLDGQDDQGFARGLAARLREAVVESCRTSYSVGGTLSGGLDSSALAAYAASHLAGEGRPYETATSVFSVHYDGPHRDERGFVEQLRTLYPNVNTSFQSLDEPFAFAYEDLYWLHFVRVHQVNSLFLNQLLLRDLAARGCRVVLNGVGGDHLASRNTLWPLHQLLRSGRLRAFASALRAHARFRRVPARRLLRTMAAWEVGRLQCFLPMRGRGGLENHLAHTFASPSLLGRLPLATLWEGRQRALFEGRYAPLPALLTGDLLHARSYPVPDAFVFLGRLPLVEVFPFFDRRVVEYCLRVPVAQFTAQGMNRSLLRRAVIGMVPDAIRLRPRKSPVLPEEARFLAQMVPGLSARVQAVPDGSAAWEYVHRARLVNGLGRLSRQARVSRTPFSRNCLNAAGLALYLDALCTKPDLVF